MTDKKGNLYSTYNPDSKWDWYCVGGRWSDMLKLKSGGYADEARLGDIDFSPDAEEYENALHFWKVYVEDEDPDGEDTDRFIYKREYYKEFYRDAETYAKSVSGFSTHSVLTPDGMWHEIGEMGWFGISGETPEESMAWHDGYYDGFIKDEDPNLIMTIVDCHI